MVLCCLTMWQSNNQPKLLLIFSLPGKPNAPPCVCVCARVCFRNLPHPEPYDMKALLYFIKGASYSHNKELKLKNQGKTCGRRDS